MKKAQLGEDISTILFSEVEANMLRRDNIDIDNIKCPARIYDDIRTRLNSNGDYCELTIKAITNARYEYLRQLKDHCIEYYISSLINQEIADELSELCIELFSLEFIEDITSSYTNTICNEDKCVISQMLDVIKGEDYLDVYNSCIDTLSSKELKDIKKTWYRLGGYPHFCSEQKKRLYIIKGEAIATLGIEPTEYHKFSNDDVNVYAYYVIDGYNFHVPMPNKGQTITKIITGMISADYNNDSMLDIVDACDIICNELGIDSYIYDNYNAYIKENERGNPEDDEEYNNEDYGDDNDNDYYW